MDLVDKQDRLFAVHALIVLRLRNDILHVFFPGGSCVDLKELSACGIGNDLCQCRFSGSRRSI